SPIRMVIPPRAHRARRPLGKSESKASAAVSGTVSQPGHPRAYPYRGRALNIALDRKCSAKATEGGQGVVPVRTPTASATSPPSAAAYVTRAPRVKDTPNMLFKVFRRARLHREAGAHLERTAFDCADRIGSEKHDGDIDRMRILFDLLRCANAVESWHRDVHDDYVRVQSTRRIDGGTTIRCRFDGEPATSEVERVHLARVGGVVDHEDPIRVTRCSTCPIAQASAILAVVGCCTHSDLLRVRYPDPYVYV